MKPWNNKIKTNNAFTLIEISLFMGLFSIILLVLTTFFSALVQKQLEIQTMSSVDTDITYILSRLRYDVDRADDVATPAVEGETAPQLVLTIGGSSYTYALSGGTLELTGPLGAQAVSSTRTTISNVSFQRIGVSGGKPTIRVRLTIASTAQTSSGPETNDIDTIFAIH